MPLYMDIHNLPEGTTPEDVAKAHAKDMETQRKYGVEYTKYWVNDTGRKVFCLAHAPSAEAAEQVHREAHGMIPEKIIEVEPDVAEVFLGGTETNPAGAVILSGGGPDECDCEIRGSTSAGIACPLCRDQMSARWSDKQPRHLVEERPVGCLLSQRHARRRGSEGAPIPKG